MTSMTSCWLCSKVVNNISWIFSVYNRMCIVCPLFEALLGYFFNSILRRKQTRCPRIIRIKHCVFRKLCMYKLRQLTHKLYIKSFGLLFSLWVSCRSLYIHNFLKKQCLILYYVHYISRTTCIRKILMRHDLRVTRPFFFAYIGRRNFYNKRWIREKERFESSKVQKLQIKEGQWPKEKGQDDK